ncbi:class I SAM-dependent methyltransferase [Xenorhabdus sp. SGI240]|uniref:class I SAM-dependent methyltransferase n=1 Tax=Xenorhabdus sp. SGI240 TaxID=3158262 RepID=UPI0032B82AFA
MNTEILKDFLPAIRSSNYIMDFGDRAFSQRMLKEHLNQGSEFASRTISEIDRQVSFLFDQYLTQGDKLLDLGCGPGLYTTRFAEKGVTTLGVDVSPAAIEYAKEHATSAETYQQIDLDKFDSNEQFDLVLLLFGIANNLERLETLLRKLKRNLKSGAKLVFELMDLEFMKSLEQGNGTWVFHPEGGLLSEQPHYQLCRRIWLEDQKTLIDRNMVITDSAQTSIYEGVFFGFELDDFNQLLQKAGYKEAHIICHQLEKGELTKHFFMVETELA